MNLRFSANESPHKWTELETGIFAHDHKHLNRIAQSKWSHLKVPFGWIDSASLSESYK